MNTFLGLLILFVSSILVNGQTTPPVPGSAVWAGATSFRVNSTNLMRYAYVTESLASQEFRQLGTTFTVEFWVNPSAFATDVDGKWDPAYLAQGETQFLPLITRHPGLGNTNQWSHFMSLLVRTTGGLALVVYSGCGCAVEPQIQNGRQVDLFNCGFGYLLNSDSPKITANNGTIQYIPTETWTHVAFSFDGDNTDMTRTRKASLYINGDLILTNDWADPNNQPIRYNATTCVDKPMQWFRTFGQMDRVNLGYLQNQDFNTGRVVNYPTPDFNYYGFNGGFDELRIWRSVRTPSQISTYYDLSLNSRDIKNDALVAYYNFNSGPFSGLPAFTDSKGTGPIGMIVANDQTSIFRFWNATRTAKELGNVINSKNYVVANLPTTPMPWVVNRITLPSASTSGNPENSSAPILSSSFLPYNLLVSAFSAPLANAIASGYANITVNGTALTVGTVLYPADVLLLTLFCNDTLCSNLGGLATGFPFLDMGIQYQTVPTTSLAAWAYLDVNPDCDGFYDVCGVCNGDNSTCQCVFYHQFRNVRMSYILLTFMVDFLIDKVNVTAQILDETADRFSLLQMNTNVTIPSVSTQTQTLTSFYNGCLTTYCQAITKFLSVLSSLQP